MKAIVIISAGGREMLEYVERPDPVTGPGQALVEVAVAGVNFTDIGVRRGTLGTDMTAPMAARLREVIPVGRMGRPNEIAALVSYLVGPDAGYMTGASLTIDGGYVL